MDHKDPTNSSDQKTLVPRDEDWVIPGGEESSQSLLSTVLSEEELDDFVIGENLLKEVRGTQDQAGGKDFRLEGMLLVQHVNSAADDFPSNSLAIAEPIKQLMFRDLNATISEGIPRELWHQEKMLSSQWHEVTGDEFSFEEDEALEDFFDSYRIFYEATAKLNDRVLIDCRTLLDKDERILDPLDPENAISNLEWETLHKKYFLDRDLMDEQSAKVQTWLNQSILVGDLEQMQQLKKLNDDLYATRALLREIAVRYKLEEVAETKSETSALDVNSETVVDFPEIAPVRFDTPIRSKKKVSEEPAEPQLEYHFTADLVKAKSTFRRYLPVLVILLCIPVAFYISLRSIVPRAERVNLNLYKKILPLTSAYAKKGNVIGQVEAKWASLPIDKRKEQLQQFYEVLQDDEYTSVSLYYPNGDPAANVVNDQLILY